jgi:hypothetical protein
LNCGKESPEPNQRINQNFKKILEPELEVLSNLFIKKKKWKPKLEVLLKGKNQPTFVWSWFWIQD